MTICCFLHFQLNACNEITESDNDELVSQIISDLMKNDNTFVMPPGRRPVGVVVDIMVIDLPYINEVNMEFTLSHYLRITWVDIRLSFVQEAYRNISSVQPNRQRNCANPTCSTKMKEFLYFGTDLCPPQLLSNIQNRQCAF